MPDDLSILIAAACRTEAETLAGMLGSLDAACRIFDTVQDLVADIADDAGMILIDENALVEHGPALAAALGRQAEWSDIPVILLSPEPDVAIPDVIVLEPSVGPATLRNMVGWALRMRRRQFEARDRIAERESEVRASRRRLEASDTELRLVADSLPVLIAFVDSALIYRFANRSYEEWLNRTQAEIVGQSMESVLGSAEFANRAAQIAGAMAGKQQVFELDRMTPNRGRRVVDIRYLPRIRKDGSVAGIHIFVQDVTARREAEEVLRTATETLERRVAERTAELDAQMAARARVEDALRQAQKMEAVGQLTGGIAHDFNNMLTGVIGSIDIMKRRVASGRMDDLDRFMEAASVSARRAAGLTHRLLAFSRRQSLDSQPLDVNARIASLHDLMTRTLSERVALTVVPGTGIPLVLADANQLESAVLNLAINARDAMPDGGRLTVETQAVTVDAAEAAVSPELMAGRYVRIAVSDTGIGMAPDVLEKIFEPFFTTKPIGQGTGLGLSMVYGFARQSGGHLRVRSKPGRGTTVLLYLPATDAGSGDGAADAGTIVPQGDGQTVLVVEDDESVRLLVIEVLAELGYASVEAGDADSAIAILTSHRRIDLMVSDIGLPGMDGFALAQVARTKRSDLPVLFLTGYAGQATERPGVLTAGMAMMTKPFALDELAETIRDMLTM